MKHSPFLFFVLCTLTSFLFFQNQSVASAELPIDLVEFGVQLNDRNVIVNWVTTEEITTDVFLIERSDNGSNFEVIGTIEAAGNSNVDIKYYFLDAIDQATVGILEYRFTLVDIDGNVSQSSVRSVSLPIVNPIVPLSLNPTTVDLSALANIVLQTENPRVNIFDTNGVLIHSQRNFEPERIKIPEYLPKGQYLINIKSTSSRYLVRFIKA